MYAIVDKTNMRFILKHPELRLLSMWSFITLPHVAVSILPCEEPKYYESFTDLELRLLIKHTTGSDHINAHRPSMLTVCAALGAQLPVAEALNGFDLERQCAHIKEDDENRYCFLPGSATPSLMPELWAPNPLTCEQRWDSTRLRALQATLAAAAPAAPAPAGSSPSAPATPRRPTVPRGGLRDTVWQAMDRIWSEAGNPVELKSVLDLRKRCMDELEKQGCKRTSVSSELGNWWKERSAQAK